MAVQDMNKLTNPIGCWEMFTLPSTGQNPHKPAEKWLPWSTVRQCKTTTIAWMESRRRGLSKTL